MCLQMGDQCIEFMRLEVTAFLMAPVVVGTVVFVHMGVEYDIRRGRIATGRPMAPVVSLTLMYSFEVTVQTVWSGVHFVTSGPLARVATR
jgi:hypothetical protein